MNNMERGLLSWQGSLTVLIRQVMGRKLSAKFQQGHHKQGGRSAQQWPPTVLSTSSGLPWEPGLPWRALLFCQLRPPPSALINACPGVLSSEAEAAFFQQALLIDGGVLGGTHSGRSKCLHGPFLFSPDPWGTVSWNAWLPPQSLPTRLHRLCSTAE